MSVVFFSCGNGHRPKQQKKEIHFSPPVTNDVKNPIVTFLDTCIQPNTFFVPSKGNSSQIIKTKKSSRKINISAPVAIPLQGGEAGGYTFMQNYNTEQGLALSGIFCGYRDKLGNLWFGTQGGGVSRYDGKAFTNFTMAQGLPSNNILCITEDKKGNFWFGTYGGGVSRYDGKTFTNFSSAQGLANSITDITEDKNGILWFGNFGGEVLCYDGKSFSTPTFLKKLVKNSVLSITEDKIGNLWFATSNKGVYRYDGKFLTNINTTQGLAYNFVWPVTQDKKGDIWFGTQGGGISRFDKNGSELLKKENWQDTSKLGINENLIKYFKTFTTAQGLGNNVIKCITEDKREDIWFGTEGGGVSRYSTEIKGRASNFSNFTTTQGLCNNTVWSITEDKTGNLWFGTEGAGICRYDGSAVTSYTTAHGLGNNKIFKIIEDRLGNMWFCGQTGGVSRYDGKVLTNFTSDQGLPDNNAGSIYEDSKGNIWFGTSHGVSCFKSFQEGEKLSFTNFSAEQGLNSSVRYIMEDKRGNLWFATDNNGVYKYDSKSFTNFTTAHGLADNKVWCIIEDKSGIIWFGTDGGGLSRYDGNLVDAIEDGAAISDQARKKLKIINGKYVKCFTTYNSDQGLGNNSVLSAMEDRAGNLWFGTSGGGVSKFDPMSYSQSGVSSFINYTTAQGLPDNIIYDIVEDTIHNMLWFGTNLGLSGLKLNSKYSAPDKIEFENFNNNTGCPIKDVNTGAMCIDSKGIIWAGTGDKLVRFDYNGVNKNTEPLNVLIQSIKINNENISWYDLADNLNLERHSMPSKNDSMQHFDSLSVSANIAEEVTTFGLALTEMQRNIMIEKFSDVEFDSISPFYPLPDNLVLPYIHNNVTFDFAAVEPAKPYLVRYQYILEGYDNDWSPLTNKTTVTFGNIHEGNYTFRLKALSPDGIWSKPVMYTFKVLSPWYRTWWMILIYITTGFLLVGLYIRWRERKLKHEKLILEQKIKLRTKQLEEKNIAITDSIEYAENIQQTILPSNEEISKNFNEYFILYKPKDIVSGDFYWLKEREDSVLFAVADCTGHGVPGAFMSLMGHNLLNEAINGNPEHSPSEILYVLNDKILNTLKQNNKNTSAKYGMDIALISISKVKDTDQTAADSYQLQYAGAHNPLLIYRGTECFQIKANSRSIGSNKKTGEQGFTNNNFLLLKGDMLYMFSDGYVDQLGGPEGKKIFAQPFRDILQSICQLEMDEQKKILAEKLAQWKGHQSQIDDVLIVGIRI